MTVKEIFDLRKQGRIEEAYEAIRPIYATHKGRYTTLCMFWTASDIFKKRLNEKRIDEAEKIFLALKRMLPTVDDPDQKDASKRKESGTCSDSSEREQARPQVKAAGFLQYAELRLIKESEKYWKRYFAIKAASKRAQSDACIDPAECEQARPKVKRWLENKITDLIASQQKVLDFIRSHPGVSVPKLNEGLNIPSKSFERHIAALIEKGMVEHRGSKKTGGYYAL